MSAQTFEEWFEECFPKINAKANARSALAIDKRTIARMAWEDSRAALVISRPEKCEFAQVDGPYHKGYRQGMRYMVDAIEAAGLKVKP